MLLWWILAVDGVGSLRNSLHRVRTFRAVVPGSRERGALEHDVPETVPLIVGSARLNDDVHRAHLVHLGAAESACADSGTVPERSPVLAGELVELAAASDPQYSLPCAHRERNDLERGVGD